MNALHVLEMSANPLDNNGIEPGAFEGVTVFHIRIAEAKLTSIPKEQDAKWIGKGDVWTQGDRWRHDWEHLGERQQWLEGRRWQQRPRATDTHGSSLGTGHKGLGS